MKIVNSNCTKLAKDNKDRFDLLQKEYEVLDNAFREQITDIRHKIDVDLKTIEERTLMVIDKAALK